MCALLAIGIKPPDLLRKVCLKVAAFQQIRNVCPVKVSVFGNIKNPGESFSTLPTENTDDLIVSEGVEFPLNAVAVRVLCTVKAAVRDSHFTEDIVCRFSCGIEIDLIFRQVICRAVRHDEQSIVV